MDFEISDGAICAWDWMMITCGQEQIIDILTAVRLDSLPPKVQCFLPRTKRLAVRDETPRSWFQSRWTASTGFKGKVPTVRITHINLSVQASGRSMLFLILVGYQSPPTYSFRVIVIVVRRGLSFCLVNVALVLILKRHFFSDRVLCGWVAVHLGPTIDS